MSETRCVHCATPTEPTSALRGDGGWSCLRCAERSAITTAAAQEVHQRRRRLALGGLVALGALAALAALARGG